MRSKITSWLSLVAKILVAVGLIVFMIRSGHLDLAVLWRLMTPQNIALGVGLAGLAILAAAWRWIVLLKARGFYIPFTYGASLYLIGMFFNYALPGAVSGDLVRGYYLVRDYPAHKLDSVLSIFIDRVLGLYSFFILTLIAVAWDFDFVIHHEHVRVIALFTTCVFVALTLGFIVCFSHRLYRTLRLHVLSQKIPPLHKLIEGCQRFGRDRKIILFSLCMSLVSQFFSMLFFYQMAVVMNEPDITWQAILFAVPMGFLVTAIPIAPAGVGVGQVAFLYLFSTYVGHSTQFGATAITAFQLATAVWALLGAFFYIRRHKPNDLSHMQEDMDAIAETT